MVTFDRTMDFKVTLQTLLEKAILCFNSGDYNALGDLLVSDVHFIAPEYDNHIIQHPKVEFHDKKKLFKYWKQLHATYPFIIAEYEFIEIGKISKFRNFMSDIGYIIDAEIHFNEYGKATKLYNSISGIIK